MANTTGKKFGGRKQGTPNKTTAAIRQTIEAVIYDYSMKQRFIEDLKVLEPKDRLQAIDRLLKFILPTMQAVNMDIDLGGLSDTQLDYIVDTLIKREDKSTNE